MSPWATKQLFIPRGHVLDGKILGHWSTSIDYSLLRVPDPIIRCTHAVHYVTTKVVYFACRWAIIVLQGCIAKAAWVVNMWVYVRQAASITSHPILLPLCKCGLGDGGRDKEHTQRTVILRRRKADESSEIKECPRLLGHPWRTAQILVASV